MSEPRQLRNPPITEAIIDIRAELGGGFVAARLREAESLLGDDYLFAGEQRLFVGTFSLGEPKGVVQQGPAVVGYRFRTKDERFVVQLTGEGFAVSQLRGYTTWEALVGEAAKLWDVFVSLAAPKRVLRVGTRFLNRIKLPVPGGELDDYFTTLPAIPEGVPQNTSTLLVRMLLDDETPPFSVSVTQYLEYADDGFPWMIVDIDAFSRETYEVNKSIIWEALGGLRILKNRVFFGSLTDTALELFE